MVVFMTGLTVHIGPLSHVCVMLSHRSVGQLGASGHTRRIPRVAMRNAVRHNGPVGRIKACMNKT